MCWLIGSLIMKAPRLTDFDPNTEQPPELHSPLDGMPSIEKPSQPEAQGVAPIAPHLADSAQDEVPADSLVPQRSAERPPDAPTDRSIDAPVGRRGGQSTVGVEKRAIARHSFEFYEDQAAALRRFSLEEKMQ